MKPKRYVALGVCLTVASLFLCSTSNYPMSVSIAEPMDSHSVNGALDHALVYIEQKYDLPGLTHLAWNASVDNHPDLSYATHHVFTNKPETVSELQAAYAIDPAHSGFWTGQLTVIVHAPDDQHFSHQVTLIDAEEHILWSGKVDVDGHIAEFMQYE